MARKTGKSNAVVPGGVDEYIAACPEVVRDKLDGIRAAVRDAAPDAIETVGYFQMPGYCYGGYDYNGMFAWFSFKAPHIRLHVRPPVLEQHARDLGSFQPRRPSSAFPWTRRCRRHWSRSW